MKMFLLKIILVGISATLAFALGGGFHPACWGFCAGITIGSLIGRAESEERR